MELWDTADLLEVTYADDAAPPDGFWLTNFYGRVFTSQAEVIYFDQLPNRDRRLAPFVSPNVQGRVMRHRGTSLASFAPAYVKPKHVVDPSKAIARRPGEPLGGLNTGTLTLNQRYDAAVADNIRVERELIERRWDHMACRATAYGQVVVVGEDYPEVTVDFQRDASLTAVLAGAAQWGGPDATPMSTIGVLRSRAFKAGRASIGRLIFGVDAFNAFAEADEVKRLLDNMRRGSESNFNTTGLSEGAPVEYMGQISGPNGAGRLDMYVYSNEYEDDTGAMVPYIDPGDVIGVGNNLGGVRAFGAIKDKRAGLQSMPIFPKMWENEDPSATFTMSQSAPLMVPTNPNNSFRIRAT
jgi:hypothetical protein